MEEDKVSRCTDFLPPKKDVNHLQLGLKGQSFSGKVLIIDSNAGLGVVIKPSIVEFLMHCEINLSDIVMMTPSEAVEKNLLPNLANISKGQTLIIEDFSAFVERHAKKENKRTIKGTKKVEKEHPFNKFRKNKNKF